MVKAELNLDHEWLDISLALKTAHFDRLTIKLNYVLTLSSLPSSPK